MSTVGLYFEDVEIGDDVGPLQRAVSDDQVVEFVGVWGAESRPSRFTDAEVAREEGLPGPIVPGAMTMALMSQLLTGWSPTVLLKRLDVVFRQMVPHNTPLRIQGIVTDKTTVEGEPRVECDVFMESGDGVRLTIGSATVVLPTRQA